MASTFAESDPKWCEWAPGGTAGVRLRVWEIWGRFGHLHVFHLWKTFTLTLTFVKSDPSMALLGSGYASCKPFCELWAIFSLFDLCRFLSLSGPPGARLHTHVKFSKDGAIFMDLTWTFADSDLLVALLGWGYHAWEIWWRFGHLHVLHLWPPWPSSNLILQWHSWGQATHHEKCLRTSGHF